MSVHGSGLSSSDQTFQLSTTEVFGLHCQLCNVHVLSQQLVLPHPHRVDVEDLESALLIWQAWDGEQNTPNALSTALKIPLALPSASLPPKAPSHHEQLALTLRVPENAFH